MKGWIFEPKHDGYRMLCSKDHEGVHLLSRNRKDATSWFPELIPSLHALPGSFILDGEVCVVDDSGVPDFEKLRGLARPRKTGCAHVVLFAFDLLVSHGKDLRALPLVERKKRLAALLAKIDGPPLVYVEHTHTTGRDLYQAAVTLGLEGVVGKRADSPYVGGRSRDWIKSKPAGYHDGWKRPGRRKPSQ